MVLLISGFSFLACMPSGGPVGHDVENEQAKQEQPVGKPGKRQTDSFGDPLPPGAVARMGTVRFRHGNGVSLIAFSANGKKLVFGGRGELDNDIRMVETSTGKELRTFDLKRGEVPWGMDLSPDGNILAVGAFNSSKPDGAFVVWDTTTGKELARIDCGKQPSDVVVFSPNSKVLVTHDYKRIHDTNNYQTGMKAWDAATGKLLHEFQDLEGRVSRPAFSPDGKRLAFTTIVPFPQDGKRGPTNGFFYDTATWHVVKPMAARPPVPPGWHQDEREFLAFSPDGKLLVGGDFVKHIDFMKADTGELIERAELPLATRSITSLSFSHDGKMLAVVSDFDIVSIWDTATRKVLFNLGPHATVAVFSPAEPILVTGGAQNVRYGTLPFRDYPAVRFWDPSNGKEILKNDAPTAAVQVTHWLQGGKLLAVSPAENCYRLWDWHTGKQIARVSFGGKYLGCIWSAVSPDGKLLAISQPSGQGNDETIQIFDLAAGKESHRLESKMVRLPIGFTADGRFLLAGVDPNLVTIWDTADGKVSRTLDLKNELQKAFAMLGSISGDGKKLALQVSELLVEPVGPDPGHQVWPTGYYRCVIDTSTGKKLWSTARDDSALKGGFPQTADTFAFSPDGKLLAERVGQTINLRDSATGATLTVLKCEKEWYQWAKQANAMTFTPDSKKLIAADLRNNIYVWDVATGKELQKFTGHRGSIFSVSVSLDGRMFATASEDSTVLIWQLDGG